MNFTTLTALAAPRVKALVGLSPSLLADLLRVVWPELERRGAARRESRAGRNRQLVANDGRPRVVTPGHEVLRTLLDWRPNGQPEVVGALFRGRAAPAEQACHAGMPLWGDGGPAEQGEAEKTGRTGDPTWTPEDVDQVLIASCAAPVRRPALPEPPPRLYSGKQKRHPLKTQLATAQGGASLTLAAGQRGPQADLKRSEEAPWPEPIADKPRRGDKGS